MKNTDISYIFWGLYKEWCRNRATQPTIKEFCEWSEANYDRLMI